MSNLLASLHHTGKRRVVLGHTLNTLRHIITKKISKYFKLIYDFVLGCIHSHPGPHAACGPQVRHPWKPSFHSISLLHSEFSYFIKLPISKILSSDHPLWRKLPTSPHSFAPSYSFIFLFRLSIFWLLLFFLQMIWASFPSPITTSSSHAIILSPYPSSTATQGP